MPIAKIKLEDGRIARFEVPEGTTQEQVLQFAQQNMKQLQSQQQEPKAEAQFRPREDIIKDLNFLQSTMSRSNKDDNLAKILELQKELESAPNVGNMASSILEPAATIATGAIAEPIAGVAGLLQSINPFAEEGDGARAVEKTREALTFKPKTEKGMRGLKAAGAALEPIGQAMQSVEKGLGDSVFNLTKSPALAAAAATLPTAIIELATAGFGGKLAKGAKAAKPAARQIKSMLNEAAPDVETLKNISRKVYKELDDSGIRISAESYNQLVKNVKKAAKKQGLSKRTTKKSFGAIEDLEDVIGDSPKLSDIDDLRKVAQGVASDIDMTEKAIGGRIVSEIDDFLDKISPDKLIRPDGVEIADIGAKYKAARGLWGRARKSEMVTEAIENAKGRASGFENGIRIELGKLAKNKRSKKFLSKAEIAAIKDIERGNVQQNLAKFLGRFAFNEGRANNVLSALGGVAGGAALGGAAGAVAAPVVGQVARGIAAKLTKGRANFLDSVIRAGKSGEDITKAYLTAIPRGKRSAGELSRLLSDPSLNLDPLFKSANETIKKAAEIAAGNQIIGQAAGALAPTALTSTQEE